MVAAFRAVHENSTMTANHTKIKVTRVEKEIIMEMVFRGTTTKRNTLAILAGRLRRQLNEKIKAMAATEEAKKQMKATKAKKQMKATKADQDKQLMPPPF